MMPRTDFRTLYEMYAYDDFPWCSRKKKNAKYDKLIEIVKYLSKKKVNNERTVWE